jgi:uncharacterized protein YlxW (UPF0749 family)
MTIKTKRRKVLLLLTSIFLGAFIVLQSQSFRTVTDEYLRENKVDIFQEIKILRDKNKDLENEVKSLEDNLDQLSDQTSALSVIEKEIYTYKKLSGDSPIFGAGLLIEADGELSVPSAIDLTNELFNAGAEAVSINSIRITNETIGFDAMPKGKILLNGVPLAAPYVFEAIGEPSTLENILTLPGGIFSRIEAGTAHIKLTFEKKEIIQMK